MILSSVRSAHCYGIVCLLLSLLIGRILSSVRSAHCYGIVCLLLGLLIGRILSLLGLLIGMILPSVRSATVGTLAAGFVVCKFDLDKKFSELAGCLASDSDS